jgi:Ca2+-binding RTX toxin-like protein
MSSGVGSLIRRVASTILVAVVIMLPSSARAAVIEGTPGDDCCLAGTINSDTINAYGGNDTAHGKDGGDTLHMGDGNDKGYGDNGPDNVYGGASGTSYPGDWLIGGPGQDLLQDNSGSDLDYACGEGNNDTLDVTDGDGNDDAVGGAGSDILYGDPGDTLVEGDLGCPP